MDVNIVLAGILGLAFSTLQLLLLQRVFSAKSKGIRVLIMLAKLPLWAMAFAGIALWWGVGPLLAFGLLAGVSYLAVSVLFFLRSARKSN